MMDDEFDALTNDLQSTLLSFDQPAPQTAKTNQTTSTTQTKPDVKTTPTLTQAIAPSVAEPMDANAEIKDANSRLGSRDALEVEFALRILINYALESKKFLKV